MVESLEGGLPTNAEECVGKPGIRGFSPVIIYGGKSREFQ